MNTLDAFRRFVDAEAKGNEKMVFDWDKAARLIRQKKPTVASAGLKDDWEYTGGFIYQDGKPITDSYTYLASIWATPELNIDGKKIPCYRMKHEVPDWDADTKRPESALNILKGGEKNEMLA